MPIACQLTHVRCVSTCPVPHVNVTKGKIATIKHINLWVWLLVGVDNGHVWLTAKVVK